jgi:hypothetical protein
VQLLEPHQHRDHVVTLGRRGMTFGPSANARSGFRVDAVPRAALLRVSRAMIALGCGH